MPHELAEQAKQKALPYTSMAELLGERYHVGVDFLRQLNAGKNLDQLKEGDTVKVPNVVPPFNLAQVIALRTYTADRAKGIKEKGKDKSGAAPTGTPPAEMPGPTVPRVGLGAARLRDPVARGGFAHARAVAFAHPRRG